MKITVVGAGAKGSLTGGLLKEGGEDVCLYSTNKEPIARIKKGGLIIECIGGERSVAEAKGVRLLKEDMLQAAYDLAEKNADSFCSMAQDILKGKKTEIDFISGAVVREGEKIAIDTPINQTMTYLVKAIEETQQGEI
jgi:2-dehydropantoate 2-reductase